MESNNIQAINNIKTLAHSVAPYASYFHANDRFAEIDDAVQKAENALLALAYLMERLNDASK